MVCHHSRLAARGRVIVLSCFLHEEESSDRRVFLALGRAARCVNLGIELSGVQAQEEFSKLSLACRKQQDTQKEQGADLQPSLSDYGEKRSSWEVCSLLQMEEAVKVAGGRAKLIPTERAQCSGSESWFIVTKAFYSKNSASKAELLP